MSAIPKTASENNKSFSQILGVNFFTGNASEAVDRMNHLGGLLVVPAAPALKDLSSNQSYREALVCADFAITDSAFMVLIWNCIDRHRIRRVSGLAYLREFLSRSETRAPGATFWIMASAQSARRNADWLRLRGLPLLTEDIYIAPFYRGEIADPSLLTTLRHRRPRHIVVTIGGGTQERLGLYLKRSLDFSPVDPLHRRSHSISERRSGSHTPMGRPSLSGLGISLLLGSAAVCCPLLGCAQTPAAYASLPS